MTKFIKNTCLGLSIVSCAALYADDWTNYLDVYWFDAWQTELDRGSLVRPSNALSGTMTTTDESLDRNTGQWITGGSDLYLDTTTGTWARLGGTTDYNITTTTTTNDTLEIEDGFVRLEGITDVSGQSFQISECFDIPVVTFSSGAAQYVMSWKAKEAYTLNDWQPTSWYNGTPYTSLSAFVEDDSGFLWDEQNARSAGFRLNATLADGSGDLVVLYWDANGTLTEGDVIGDWNASYTLPGQTATSIQFHVAPEFTYDNPDFLFATMYDDGNGNSVWMGQHKPAATTWQPISGGYNGNATGWNDIMNAIAPYDFSKLVNCDLADRAVGYDIGEGYRRISYYGNMNFVTETYDQNGAPQVLGWGTWSVENGIVVHDEVYDDINKTVTVVKADLPAYKVTYTKTGRGELVSQNGQTFDYPLQHLSQTNIPVKMTTAMLKGKKIPLDYTENGVTDSGIAYLYPNMTFAFGDSQGQGASSDDVGVWKIENGALILDSYWLGTDGVRRETGTESWVFTDGTHANVYIGNTATANITITGNITDITTADPIPANFTSDAVPYIVSEAEVAGKQITLVVDPANPSIVETLYFYPDMSFKMDTFDDLGNPEVITGQWHVEDGVLIIDVVYDDTHSSHYVITFDQAPAANSTFSFMEVTGGNTTRDTGIPIQTISDIPTQSPTNAMPAVIMYLLN